MRAETRPNINITPLIDVLLVLLIIFMVVSPLKPSSFKTKIPAESKNEKAVPNPKTLVVTVNADSSLQLNGERFGTIAEPQNLIDKLSKTFAERRENRVYSDAAATRVDLPEEEKIERTVFVKAPRDFSYGGVAKVVDAVKTAGAHPVGLQIDRLD